MTERETEEARRAQCDYVKFGSSALHTLVPITHPRAGNLNLSAERVASHKLVS